MPARVGLCDLASESLKSALDRYEELADTNLVARANLFLADIELVRGNPLSAQSCTQRAQSIFEFLENETLLRECSLLRGNISAALGDHETALSIYKELYEQRTNIDSQWIPARARMFWGELLVAAGEEESGKAIIQSIEPVLKALGEAKLLLRAHKILGI